MTRLWLATGGVVLMATGVLIIVITLMEHYLTPRWDRRQDLRRMIGR